MNFFTEADLQAIWLTLKLASLVTVLLLIISTPIAWWLSQTQSSLKNFINAIVTLPLVLPPTVLGFYLLVVMAPQGILGSFTQLFGLETLAFTFAGLVIASLIYSLPFAVQPIYNAFVSLGSRPLEVASTLRASPWDTFFHVVIPLCKPGFISAAILTFAHTIGEFGVILMIGGNIPGVTQVISVQIYDHVETMNYSQAHVLALTMVLFSLLVLIILNYLNKNQRNLV